MSSPFVAEIRAFPFNFAPKGWAVCDGQLMAISQNTALFSLLGTMYGGNAITTFALPDLQGSSPLGLGQGPGLDDYLQGQTGGSATVTLLQSEIPAHGHTLSVSSRSAAERQPGGQDLAVGRGIGMYGDASGNAATQLSPQALAPAGAGYPHNNMQPYLTLQFCIALQGVFPARP